MKKVNKFELIKHRKTNNVEIDPYKTPSGVQIMIKYTAKNLSDYSTNKKGNIYQVTKHYV